MILQDLETHILSQNAEIQEWRDCFSDLKPRHPWAALRNSLWGIGLESLREGRFEAQEVKFRMDDEPVLEPSDATVTRPVVDVPKSFPRFWYQDPKILIRTEYEEAELAALSANEACVDAFIVTGQSGIGKSVFLVWLLMERLALGLPTVLQVEKSNVILFHEGGASKFDLDSAAVYGQSCPTNRSARIWALVDLNQGLLEPSPIFGYPGPFFVVEAASPRQRHDWTYKVSSEEFYMATWTFSEVLQARPFLGLSYGGPYEKSELWHLYNTYGASPRELSMYARKPEIHEVNVINQIARMRPDNLPCALQSPGFKDTHLFIRIEPVPGLRRLPVMTIASQGVLRLLWDRHLKDRVSTSSASTISSKAV